MIFDGGGHYTEERMKKDAIRTKETENMGMAVLRICNTDTDRNFISVCEYMDAAVKKSQIL